VSGSNGYRLSNGTATVTTSNYSLLGNYANKKISVRLAAFDVSGTINNDLTLVIM
jgi:hypothetical protein